MGAATAGDTPALAGLVTFKLPPDPRTAAPLLGPTAMVADAGTAMDASCCWALLGGVTKDAVVVGGAAAKQQGCG
jgi:hypothetical protein